MGEADVALLKGLLNPILRRLADSRSRMRAMTHVGWVLVHIGTMRMAMTGLKDEYKQWGKEV